MKSCCTFRSTLKVLAVVGAVGTLSATTLAQTLDKGAKKAPVSTAPVAKPALVQSNLPISTGATKQGVQTVKNATVGALTAPATPAKGVHQTPGRTLSGASNPVKNAPVAAPRGGGDGADACGAASPIGDGTFNFDTTGATQDATVTCGFNPLFDVWFDYTAPANGTTVWSTCGGTTGDTVLAVFDSCGGTQLLCLDDFCGLQTSVTFVTTAGTHYWLRLAGYNSSTVVGTMTVTNTPSGGCAEPGNGCCANATVVAVPSTTNYDMTGSGNDWPGTCGGTGATEDVWFVATAPSTGIMIFSACGLQANDTVFTVLDECGGPQILCLDDFCGLQTEVSFPVVAGEDYYLRIADFAGGVHAGTFSAAMQAACVLTPPPGTPEGEACGTDTNGGCNSPSPIFGTITCGETVLGTAFADGATRDTDWYDLVLPGPTQITLTGNAQFPWQMLILDTNCPVGIIAATTGLRCTEGTLTATVAGSCRVFFSNSGFAGNNCGAENDYYMTVTTCTPVAGAPNDLCANAEAISGPGVFPFDNTVAGQDGLGDPLCLAFGLDNISNDVWFDWTSTCADGEQAILDFCGQTGNDTRVAVYDGASCTGPILACNDDSCGLQSRVRWNPVPGNVYKIRVGSFPGAVGGPGTFTIQCAAVLPPACTAFNPGTDCQNPSFVDGYNCTNFLLAEDITSNVAVTDLCINGIYFANAPVPDAWVVTFLEDTAGRPDTSLVIDTFTQGVDMIVTGPAPNGQVTFGRDVYQWNCVLSRPVAAPITRCVWVQMQNFATGDSVFIQTADTNGDFQTAQDLDNSGTYGPTDVQPNDVAICINGGFRNNAICFLDPCAGNTPANDTCGAAAPLSIGTVHGTSLCSTADGTPSCSGLAIGSGVWYSVIGDGNTMTVDFCASAFYDTAVEVYCGGCAVPTCVIGNDDFCGLQSGASWCSAAGTEYLVFVHGFGGQTGEFDITLSSDGTPCSTPPSCTPPPPCTEACTAAAGDCQDRTDVDGLNTTNFLVADKVRTSAPITHLCWSGVYIDNSAPATQTFQVRFLADNAGLPDTGNVLATYNSGSTMTVGCAFDTGTLLLGAFNVFEYNVTLGTPFAGSVSDCVWIEISSGGEAFFWQTGTGGDGSAVQDIDNSGTYEAGEVTVNDQAFCANGRVAAVPCGSLVPCCDFNNDNLINSQDFFDFLVAFFGNLPTSDFNADGILNSQDFFDFIVCFFGPPAGCP